MYTRKEAITFSPFFWEKINPKKQKIAHLVIIGTKPDIIKQAPVILALKKTKANLIIGHTGQHFEDNLNQDAKEIFKFTPDFNLNINGSICQKISQIIERLGNIIWELKRRKIIIVPYVHGDTTTANAAAFACYMNTIPVVHIEAGLRSFNPKEKILKLLLKSKNPDIKKYHTLLLSPQNWEKGSVEPFPEQFNTRTVASTAALHNAPLNLNKNNLLEEGHRRDRIFVYGNTIADAVEFTLKQRNAINEKYPQLKKGFIRFTVHRRENINSRRRFKAIFDAMETLVRNKEIVLWLSHNANKYAVKSFGLEGRIKKLIKKYDNFIYSDRLWTYNENIQAMRYAVVNVSDSGSEQEEANILRLPMVTIRFGSDRPETIWAGSNIVAPPISKEIILGAIRYAIENQKMKEAPTLYGQNVAEKIIHKTEEILRREKFFQWEHERLGLKLGNFWKQDKIEEF